MVLEAAGAEGSSDIPMREVYAGEILEKIQKGVAVEYDHIVVKGNLDLSRENLHKNITSSVRINDSIFDGWVSLYDTTLEKPVDLSSSNFTRGADFVKVTFNERIAFNETTFSEANFMEATFSGDAYFKSAAFSDFVRFDGATFGRDADFSDSTFSTYSERDGVGFSGSTFNGDADFLGAKFIRYAIFSSAVFSGYANFFMVKFSDFVHFDGATFKENANFLGAAFSGNALFDRVAFSGIALFNRAAFSGDASFWMANFSGGADFKEAAFSGEASFERAAFSGDANFRMAAFSSNSSFEDAEFNKNIEFSDIRFENETSFYRILFKRPAYFENCSINSLNLTKAEYSRLHLRWGDIKSLHFDEAAYLALIKNYNTLGWYGDANRCYYDYRNAVRRSWQAPSSGFAARLSSLLDRLIDFVEWILYGYGVRPSFPVAWSAIIILAFGLFFRQKRCLRKIIIEERIEKARGGSDEVLVQTKLRKAPINSLDTFLFSLFTFTSGFTAFLHPAVEYKLERCLRWAIFERLLGPFFLALVITTISKTYLIR